MSYITRTGNLAETPTLREGGSGQYTYARVIVSDASARMASPTPMGRRSPTTSP